MSKIALTPSATGTGVFTISSPATNTDRTLTLPDEAGSIVVNTATGIDVTGTVTADGLTVDGVATVTGTNLTINSSASTPYIGFGENGTTGLLIGESSIIGAGGGYDIYAAANKGLTFFTNASRAVDIDTAGNVGIGVNDPDATLDISKGSNALGILRVTQRASGAAAYGLDVGLDPTTGDPVFSRIVSDTVTEAFRIQRSTGNVAISNTAPVGGAGLTVRGYGYNGNGVYIGGYANNEMLVLNSQYAQSTGGIRFKNLATTVGSITFDSTGTSFNTSSDYRLKTDIKPMADVFERVKLLKPCNFEWINGGIRTDGFLAHELAEVIPIAISGTKDAMKDEEYEVTAAIEATYDEDGNELTAAVPAVMGTRSVPDMQGIDQSKLVPLLTAALQEALNKIEAMETRLAALEAV
jgi:osmotically-inducible protein OsmY